MLSTLILQLSTLTIIYQQSYTIIYVIIFPNGIISDYIGCFEEDFADREFGVSVGNYETWDMTPEFCIKECAARSYP